MASENLNKALTIDEMLEQTPEGETKLFEAPIQGVIEERFFSTRFNSEYPLPIEWDEGLPPLEAPCLGTRTHPPIPLSVLPEPNITAKSKSNRLVDFYSWGSGNMFLISNKLVEVIEKLDPESLECRPVLIRAQDRAVDYNLVMPKRNIEAIDLERTDVLIKGEQVGTFWVKRVQFPNGIVFQKAGLSHVQNFSDIDEHGWFWSRELIDAAKAAAVRGPRLKRAGLGIGGNVELL